MVKKLILQEKMPDLYVYNFHAYMQTVLRDQSYFEAWLYENYIQIVFNPESGLPIDFLDDGFEDNINIEFENFTHQDIRDIKQTPTNFIIKKMTEGHFIYAAVDEFYLGCRSCYNKYHMEHCNMIVGFDKEKKTLDIVGYSDRNYKLCQTSFDKFETAFLEKFSVQTLKAIDKENTEIDIKKVYQSLCALARSDNSYIKFPIQKEHQSPFHGLKVYEKIEDMCFKIHESGDLRVLHLLYEHKKIMCSRIKYLEKHNFIKDCDYIYEEYKKLEDIFLGFRNKLTKAKIIGDPDRIKKSVSIIKEELKNIAIHEKKLLEELIDNLYTNNKVLNIANKE